MIIGISNNKNKLYGWGDMMNKGFNGVFNYDITFEPTKVTKKIFS
jgi:hypothetical protein